MKLYIFTKWEIVVEIVLDWRFVPFAQLDLKKEERVRRRKKWRVVGLKKKNGAESPVKTVSYPSWLLYHWRQDK